MNLRAFANETASESPAPGGGSISAYVGSLGAALATMVANLSSQKKGWEEQWNYFSEWAEKGQKIKDNLLKMVDEDTRAFNRIMDGFAMPKNTDAEKSARSKALQEATLNAIHVPLQVMKLSFQSFEIIEVMAKEGNPNSVSDAGVGALCARTAIQGAYLNVRINAAGLKDESLKSGLLNEAEDLLQKSFGREKEILDIVQQKL